MSQRFTSKSAKYGEELQAEVQRLMREQDRLMTEMGSKWDQKKAQVMNKIPVNNRNERQKIFKDQTLRYFKSKYEIDLEGYFGPRPNIISSLNLSYQQESIIVYGVDFFSPTRLYNYFRYFLPTNISWINDSTCKISFKYCAGAKRAILQNILPDCGNIYKIQKDIWYPLKPYFVLGFQRKLEARVATNFDITVTEIQNSKYHIYQTARKSYLQEFQKLNKSVPVQGPPVILNYTFSTENKYTATNRFEQNQPEQSIEQHQNSGIKSDHSSVFDPFMTNLTRISKNAHKNFEAQNDHSSKVIQENDYIQQDSIVDYLESLHIVTQPKFPHDNFPSKSLFD